MGFNYGVVHVLNYLLVKIMFVFCILIAIVEIYRVTLRIKASVTKSGTTPNSISYLMSSFLTEQAWGNKWLSKVLSQDWLWLVLKTTQMNSKKFVGHSCESRACVIRTEVRYFGTSNWIFPGLRVSWRLVKGN